MADHILIIEDEPDLASLLAYNLEREGFSTTRASTGEEGLAAAGIRVPDLVLLDLMLPDQPGVEVCRALRRIERTASVPIIIVSAKGEEVDRVVGFEVGADDYVVKPFSPREVVLRVRALLKRARRGETRRSDATVLRAGEIELDTVQHRVTVGGSDCALTALEFRLLQTFMGMPGYVRSREQLLDEVWGIDIEVTHRTVDTHVKRLREKLGEAGETIETVRGVGYRFRDG